MRPARPLFDRGPLSFLELLFAKALEPPTLPALLSFLPAKIPDKIRDHNQGDDRQPNERWRQTAGAPSDWLDFLVQRVGQSGIG